MFYFSVLDICPCMRSKSQSNLCKNNILNSLGLSNILDGEQVDKAIDVGVFDPDITNSNYLNPYQSLLYPKHPSSDSNCFMFTNPPHVVLHLLTPVL